jgi:hypothetical protein
MENDMPEAAWMQVRAMCTTTVPLTSKEARLRGEGTTLTACRRGHGQRVHRQTQRAGHVSKSPLCDMHQMAQG